MNSILKQLIFLLLCIYLFGCKQNNIDDISRPVVLGSFKIYTTSGKVVDLKSSKINAEPNDIAIYRELHNKEFEVGGIKYFIFDGQGYECGSLVFVNSDNGSITYIDDFDLVIKFNADKAFVIALHNNEMCSDKSGITIYEATKDKIQEVYYMKHNSLPEKAIEHKIENDGSMDIKVNYDKYTDVEKPGIIHLHYLNGVWSHNLEILN